MTVREGLTLIRHHLALVLGCVVLGVAIGLLVPLPGSQESEVNARALVSVRTTDGRSVDVGTMLGNVITIGLTNEDFESLREAAGLTMSSQELASAVTIGRVTGSTVVEVSVKLAARSEAAAVAQNAIELVVQHLAEIVGEGAEVSIIADNYPSEEGNGSADLWLRRAGIGAVLGAGLAALALAIAQSTRGIVLGDQTAEAIARAPILARVKRRRSNADDREFDPRVFTEKLAILTGNPVRFLVLVCASPAEASLATRSAALKRVAEAMGADTMTLGSQGRSGHEMLSRWEELARIGPYQASIVVSAELQSRSAGADT
ncbi:MAG: hypothetical protein LBE08_05140, partial [Bifidobacteriaceae bacterium]|nr:hypothetical protein [Bifidobacteriaceae bacterium]